MIEEKNLPLVFSLSFNRINCVNYSCSFVCAIHWDRKSIEKQHNWNPTDWDRSKPKIRNGREAWGDKLCSWKTIPKSRKGRKFNQKWLLQNWIQLKPTIETVSRPKFAMGETVETDFGHWPYGYISEEDSWISERSEVRSKMFTAQLSKIQTQFIETIFTSKFGIGEGLRSENHPLVSRSAGTSIIEDKSAQWAQLIPVDSSPKIAMEMSISCSPFVRKKLFQLWSYST